MNALTNRELRAAIDALHRIGEYYRPIRIDHVMAVPVHADQRFLVSFEFDRSGRRAFSERNLSILDLIRPQMNHLYRQAVA